MKNTETQIPSHVVKTLGELDAEIKVRQTETAQLLQCRGSLMELYGIPASLPMGNVQATAEKAKRGRPAKAALGEKPSSALPPPSSPEPAERKRGLPMSGDSVKLLAVMRMAPEPFTAAALSVNSGLEKKFIADRLFTWSTKKGWITKVAHGQYKRAGEFPAAAPETE